MIPSIRTRRLVRALERGKFKRLLGNTQEFARWEHFVMRAANTPGCTQVVLRLPMTSSSGDWYLWAVYEFLPGSSTDRSAITLASIIIPAEPEGSLSTPDEVSQHPIFEASD